MKLEANNIKTTGSDIKMDLTAITDKESAVNKIKNGVALATNLILGIVESASKSNKLQSNESLQAYINGPAHKAIKTLVETLLFGEAIR